MSAWKKLYHDFLKRVYRRRKEKIRFKPCSLTGKLYPLRPIGSYDDFAKYVWEKRGRPKIHKKMPLKIKWRRQKTISYRASDNKMKYAFIAGCEISTNLRGKKFLKLSIAD